MYDVYQHNDGIIMSYINRSNLFFILPLGQQQDARDVSERYIGKSTPNASDGLFEKIENFRLHLL